MLINRLKKYQELLKDQIQQASEWLSNNKEEIANHSLGFMDVRIIIHLENGDSIPAIKVIKEHALITVNKESEDDEE